MQDDIARGEFDDKDGNPALLVHLLDNEDNNRTSGVVVDSTVLAGSDIKNTGDLFHWHVLISPQQGNYYGLRLHATMSFTERFPSAPPSIALDTNIPHSNTFGGIGRWHAGDDAYICLDLLSEFSQKPFAGWTPAYSVSALLRQFQTFLFDQWVGDFFHGLCRVILFSQEQSDQHQEDQESSHTHTLQMKIKNLQCK